MFGALLERLRSPRSVFRDGHSLMLTQTEFNREIARERIRATRRSIPFCVLTISLVGKRQRRLRRQRLIRLLHRNVRLTDQKAVLAGDRLGILLVDTPEMGGRAVLDRLTHLFDSHHLNTSLWLSVHDPEGFDPDDDHDLPTGDGRRRREDSATDRWVRVDRPPSNDGTLAMVAAPQESVAGAANVSVTSEEPLAARPRAEQFLKRSVDLIGASVGLVVFSPILVASMLAVKLSSPGPALFKQTREGLGGKPFTIYKMRTMVIDAEDEQSKLKEKSHRDGPAFKIKHDPRVTRVGHFLRKTCLDELPQLVNVIRGDMSLVGPRPLPWHESRACRHWHRRRLDVRPGLTCHWQVNKAAAETFDDWMRMDLDYVDRNDLWLDLRLIARTALVPVTGRGSE